MKFYEDRNYIKMCEKSFPLLGWQPQNGDFCFNQNLGHNNIVIFSDHTHYKIIIQDNVNYSTENIIGSENKFTPIYRQDQLQEMILDKYSFLVKLTAYVDFIKYNETYSKLNFDTHEKWWLAFVMKEKFNKTWNGEDWI